MADSAPVMMPCRIADSVPIKSLLCAISRLPVNGGGVLILVNSEQNLSPDARLAA
jgi:hypothetical protein